MLQSSTEGLVAFGSFRLDRRTGELCRVEEDISSPIPVGRRALDVLGALIDGGGRLVTKQEIMDAAWPNLAVEDSNLTVQISALRRALDGGAEPSCIQTVPGRGYRFVLPVSVLGDEAAPDVASVCSWWPACTSRRPAASWPTPVGSAPIGIRPISRPSGA